MYGDEDALLDSIDQFIDDIRERRAENDAIIAEFDRQDALEDSCDGGGGEEA